MSGDEYAQLTRKGVPYERHTKLVYNHIGRVFGDFISVEMIDKGNSIPSKAIYKWRCQVCGKEVLSNVGRFQNYPHMRECNHDPDKTALGTWYKTAGKNTNRAIQSDYKQPKVNRAKYRAMCDAYKEYADRFGTVWKKHFTAQCHIVYEMIVRKKSHTEIAKFAECPEWFVRRVEGAYQNFIAAEQREYEKCEKLLDEICPVKVEHDFDTTFSDDAGGKTIVTISHHNTNRAFSNHHKF